MAEFMAAHLAIIRAMMTAIIVAIDIARNMAARAVAFDVPVAVAISLGGHGSRHHESRRDTGEGKKLFHGLPPWQGDRRSILEGENASLLLNPCWSARSSPVQKRDGKAPI
jgi:hypothetical protein